MFTIDWALENFVRRLGTLSVLSQDDVSALLSLRGDLARLRGNADIVSAGQQFDHACLVVSGIVARFVQLNDGSRQFTAFHLPGDIADIHRVATPSAGSALQTLSTATIVRIPAKDLKRIALASPTITQAFWAYAAVDAAVLTQWAVNVGRRDAKARMAHLLCEMGVRSESCGLGSRDEFILDASQAQIGDALGLTSVHVNRTLRALREAKLLSVDGRIVRIANWPSLAAMADFDPIYLQADQQQDKAA
jgi:CRP-like cAMP-binding protein